MLATQNRPELDRFEERLGLGWTLMALARKGQAGC
jgi:hypothetical protein